jgi:hypothetical protein
VSPSWPAVVARLLPRRAEPAEEVRRKRPARPLPNGYWGNKAYKLPPEANLMAVAHYLEALDFQKEIVKIHTIFGGKNPHPNWLVGGVPCAINLDGTGAVGAINMERLNFVQDHRRDHRVHRQRLHPRPAGHRHVLQGLAGCHGGGLSAPTC